MYKTTINSKELKALDACVDGYKTFIEAHGDKTVKFSEALKSNGLDDMFWLLEAVEKDLSDQQLKDLRLLAADYALSCIDVFEKEYPDDLRPRKAILASIAYANGEITTEDLDIARSAARSAAWSAALSAAWSASESAARSAWSAARSAAWSAARSAAWSALSAAWSASESAARSARSARSANTTMLLNVLLKWEQ